MSTVTNAALAYTTVGKNNLHKEYLTLGWQVLESISANQILKISKNVPWKKKTNSIV